MSKFKLRHAKLLMSMTTLVALVVTSGAGFKFYGRRRPGAPESPPGRPVEAS